MTDDAAVNPFQLARAILNRYGWTTEVMCDPGTGRMCILGAAYAAVEGYPKLREDYATKEEQVYALLEEKHGPLVKLLHRALTEFDESYNRPAYLVDPIAAIFHFNNSTRTDKHRVDHLLVHAAQKWASK